MVVKSPCVNTVWRIRYVVAYEAIAKSIEAEYQIASGREWHVYTSAKKKCYNLFIADLWHNSRYIKRAGETPLFAPITR